MFSSSYEFSSWAELKDIFRKFGEVTYTDAHYRSGDGRGEVCFATREEQDRCLDEAEGMDINGRSNRSIRSAFFQNCFVFRHQSLGRPRSRSGKRPRKKRLAKPISKQVTRARWSRRRPTRRPVASPPNRVHSRSRQPLLPLRVSAFSCLSKATESIKLGRVERSDAQSRRSNVRRCSHAFRTR